MEKKRFIFDLDGTLLTGDYQPVYDYFAAFDQENDGKVRQKLQSSLDDYETQYFWYDRSCLSLFLTERFQNNISESVIERWIHITEHEINDTVEDGVFEVLEYLKQKGKSLVVLTNWFGQAQISRLQKKGLLEYFDCVYTGDILVKPHDRAYWLAQGGYLPGECVFIGDHLEKDYYAPRRCHMDSILYDKNDCYSKKLKKMKNMKEILKRY